MSALAAPLQLDIFEHADEVREGAEYLTRSRNRLALALVGVIYNEDSPSVHASYAWAKIREWHQVIASILATPGYRRHFSLVERLSEACFRAGDIQRSVIVASSLAALDEHAAANAYQRLPSHHRIRALWEAFGKAGLWPQLFPAYVLIAEPGLVHHVNESDLAADATGAMRAACTLLKRRQAADPALTERRELLDISPQLLEMYLQKFVAVRLRSVPRQRYNKH